MSKWLEKFNKSNQLRIQKRIKKLEEEYKEFQLNFRDSLMSDIRRRWMRENRKLKSCRGSEIQRMHKEKLRIMQKRLKGLRRSWETSITLHSTSTQATRSHMRMSCDSRG